MRLLLSTLAFATLLAACEGEAENVQATSVERERVLEQRYKEIESEAENDVAAQVAPLDNEADALLNQLAASAAAANVSNQN